MFSLAAGVYQSYFAPLKLSVLVIGLDGAGKTSLVERIKVTDIRTRLDVDAATAPPHGKGDAVALIRPGPGAADAENENTRSPQGRRPREGGRPARLPPPLPARAAARSRLAVDQMLEDGFARAAAEGGEGRGAGTHGAIALARVPPPPLAVDREPTEGPGGKPPLPPRRDPAAKSKALPTRKSSFIELLRCPSPGKYAAAKTTGEEDEEDEECSRDDEPAAGAPAPWSTEYLRDYYINYQVGEEFDVQRQRGGGGATKRMCPMERIRPTLGQNLATLDASGCRCSLLDLSGTEKMRPLWERYYRDTDAVIYVVNAAATSPSDLLESRRAFEQMCRNDTLARRARGGLPILIFANQLDLAYKEYGDSMERASNENSGRAASWNADEEGNFLGGTPPVRAQEEKGGVSKRAVGFHDLVRLFGVQDGDGTSAGDAAPADRRNIFLFGGSAKSGEGVRAAMEYLVAHAKSHYLARHARKL